MAENNVKNGTNNKEKGWKILFRVPELTTAIIIVVVSLIIGFVNPEFWSAGNWNTIFRWFIGLGLMALGESFALIIASIDLSVGSMASLTSMVFAYLLVKMGAPLPVAILVVILIAIAIGLWHGAFVTTFSPPLPTTVPGFIVTLGSLMLLRGIAVGITHGMPIPIERSKIAFFASTPGMTIIFVIMFIIAYFVQRYTAAGRFLYAVGGNIEAARVAGIPIHRTRLFAYVASAIMASISGIIYTAMLATGYADIGTGQEMYAIASCVIGGVSLAGGEGTVLGAALGALLLTIIRNGIVLMGVSPYWQDAITGIILVVAVAFDLTRRKLRG